MLLTLFITLPSSNLNSSTKLASAVEVTSNFAKGKGKIIQIDGGPPLSYNTLHKNLSVIYDVPTNPSERLNAVIKDLGEWNENLKTKSLEDKKKLQKILKKNGDYKTMTFDEYNLFIKDYSDNAEYPDINN